MKLELKSVYAALLAVIFIFGCSEQKPEKAGKDDAVLSPAKKGSKKFSISPEGKDAESKTKKLAKAIENGETPAVPENPEIPKGETIRDFMAKQDLPEVVATIGDEKITREDLIKDIEAQIPEPIRNQPLPPQVTAGLAQNLKAIVDTIVSRKLLLKLAEADGVKPSAKMLVDKFDNYLKNLPPQQLEAFKKQLEAQGSSIEKHKAEAVKDIGAQEAVAIDKWIETKVIPTVSVPDESAEKFYRENQERFKKPGTVKVAHILIAPEKPSPEKLEKMSDEEKKKFAEEADKNAKNKADEILAKVKKGEDFATLAKENSACPSGKAEGGVLPEFDNTGAIAGAGPRGGKMDKTFTDASCNLKPGDISDVVKTNFGYHIIKSVQKTEESFIPFEQVKGYLQSSLKKEELSKKVKAMLEAEKEKCNVKILVN